MVVTPYSVAKMRIGLFIISITYSWTGEACDIWAPCEAADIVVTAEVTNPKCVGDPGEVSFSSTGGFEPYSYDVCFRYWCRELERERASLERGQLVELDSRGRRVEGEGEWRRRGLEQRLWRGREL